MGESLPAAPALREMVAEHAQRVCLEGLGRSLRAIVLTGSVARDEGTVAPEGRSWRVMGDAELFLVLADGAALPPADRLRALAAAVEAGLRSAGVACRVELSPVFGRYFGALPPSIFAYELRVCGKVIWGEDVLRQARAWPAEEIPREDAFRLLWNRVIELLGAAGEAGPASPAAGYAAAKLYLDMATSLLVFGKLYEPTYRARQTSLRAWAAAEGGSPGWPFPAAEFVERVDRCTEWKLNGARPAAGGDLCAEAIRHARDLSRWELLRMTGCPADAGDGRLWTAWRRSQPAAGRFRGWLYAARARGWGRGWRNWGRWIRQAREGSPRALIYEAAYELSSGPAFPGEASAAARRILAFLPGGATGRPEGWRDLSRLIFRNYKEFLAGTRC